MKEEKERKVAFLLQSRGLYYKLLTRDPLHNSPNCCKNTSIIKKAKIVAFVFA